MSINYSNIRWLTARKIISALGNDGFYFRYQAGSHCQFCHPDGRRVTISFHHPGDTFKVKVLKSIIEAQAKWTESDLRRLKLLK